MKSLLILAIFFTVFSMFHLTSPPHRCGYYIRNDRGYISTPNFPKPYPVPITCQWVIEAPPNCKIAVYFTQFYLKTGFRASEFALYMADIGVGVSKSDFGFISSRDEPTYLMSNQRTLVLDLHVYSLDNVHLRVTEHLLETYGFNITYEVLQKNESVRQDACIYHHCSFTGFCSASEDLQEYRCECVSGYFGEECQYDFDCGPTAMSNVCYNGGTCRYYIGSSVRTCECPSGFEGAKCEIPSELKNATDDAKINCDVKHYPSHPHYIPIYPGENKCPPKGEDLYIIRANLTISESTVSEMLDLENAMEQLILKRLDFLLMKEINITFFNENKREVTIRFLAEHGSLEMRQNIRKKLMHLQNDNYSIQMTNTDLQIQPTLQIERMEISEKMPVMEGVPLLIACIVRGGPSIRVKWLKDGSPIVFPEVHGRLWNSTIPKNSFDTFTFLLGFDKTYYLDSGTLTCTVEDEIRSDRFSITISVKQLAKPLLNPLSSTVRARDPLTITCVSQEVHKDQSVTYFWTRNERPLLKIREQVEDLFPSGSRLILKEALESANYTCAIHVMSSVRKETSVINVVSDEDFASGTCHRETFLNINWRMTAVGFEDFHVCPSNYRGYIFRKCLRAENQTAIWQDPDFSRCLSDDFLEIKNGFESYSMGYRINTLNFFLEKMLKTLTDSISSLHMSEAEPLMDILSDVDTDLYLQEDAAENWKIILNTISMLLNSTSISRKQIKQKMYYFIRNISLSYGKQYMSNNSSRQFVSPTLIVKVWKIGRDFQNFLSFPCDQQLSWSSNNLELEIKVCNTTDLEGNSSVTVALIVYKSHIFAGIEKFPGNFILQTLVDDFIPLTIVEATGETSDDNVPIKVLLAYKHVVRTRKKIENTACYKIPMIESNPDIRSCEKVEISGEDVVCQCFISSFLSVVLLEKHIRLAKEIPMSLKFKILPMIGVVISIIFLLYTFGMLGCKKKFSSLFE